MSPMTSSLAGALLLMTSMMDIITSQVVPGDSVIAGGNRLPPFGETVITKRKTRLRGFVAYKFFFGGGAEGGYFCTFKLSHI